MTPRMDLFSTRQQNTCLQEACLWACLVVLSCSPPVYAETETADAAAETTQQPQTSDRVFPTPLQVQNRLWEEMKLAVEDQILDSLPMTNEEYKQWWNAQQGSQSEATITGVEQITMACMALIEPQFQLPVVRNSAEALQLADYQLPERLASWPFAERQWRAFQVQQLTRFRQYETALVLATSLQPEQVLEPIGYLFSRAVCEHHLRLQSEGMDTVSLLLLAPEELPVRYRAVTELMLEDLKLMEPESLDEISRMMNDVERRLDLGNIGDQTQKLEQEIVENLDQMIEELEQQLAQAQSQSSGAAASGTSPADDSRIKGSTAPGNVTEKELIERDGWGDVPPKERAKAQQMLKNLFPPRYQKAIQEYNRKAAQRQ